MFIFIDVPILNCFFLPYKYPLEKETHVSLLINMGFSALAIGNRVGHESEKITYRYAHLFPSVQDDMAEALDEEWKEGFDVREEEGRQEPMEE